MTPVEHGIRRREFFIDVAMVGCGLVAFYAVRSGDLAAAAFFGVLIVLLLGVIANHVVHHRLKKQARNER